LVKSNLIGGTADSIGYALELLDIFVDDDLKPKILPLLDDLSTADKLRKLEGEFPREPLGELEVLLQILNRDINHINRWTKACAIYAYVFSKDAYLEPALVAQLFNPDPLLHEMAAWAVYGYNQPYFQKYLKRVDIDIAKRIEMLWKQSEKKNILSHLEFSKIKFLFKVNLFEGLNGTEISEIADGIREIKINQHHTFELKNTQWQNDFVLVIYRGTVEVKDIKSENKATFSNHKLVASFLLDIPLENIQIKTLEDSVIWVLDSINFYKVVASRPDFTSQFLINISENEFNEPEEMNLT